MVNSVVTGGIFGHRGWCPNTLALFTSKVLAAAEIEIGVVQIVLKKPSQISRSMLQLRDFQTRRGLEMPSYAEKLDHFFRLLGKCFIDLQRTFTVGT